MDTNIWKKFIVDNVDKKSSNDTTGVVYVIEYGDYLKIGATSNINRRYRELFHQANDYFNIKIGNMFYTISHDKFFENEKRIHSLLSKYRKKNTELFDISLNDFFLHIENFNFDFSKTDKNYAGFYFAKYLVTNGLNGLKNKNNKKYSTNEIDKMFKDTYCPYCNDDEFGEIMSIIFSINKPNNSNNYVLYLLTKMQNIIVQSNERYLKSII